jgi:peptidyl-prolyl cis-trans isomerase D
MTMLDRMRQHRNWLKWSLGLVVVTFIWLYVPDFLAPPRGGVRSTEVVAEIEGRRITAGDFRRVYYEQVQAYRTAYGGNLSDEMLRQLGLDQRLLQQMIDEEAALAEAARLGVAVSDAELRERILTLPAFQENGHFIGDERYRQLLQLQRPPMSPAEFEARLRRSLTVEKLRAALTEWIAVTDEDVDREFRRRNEKVKLALVALSADAFRQGVTVDDAEVTAAFEGHREKYRVPEKRRIRYALVDLQALRDKVRVAPDEVERYYEDNRDQYSSPEQVHAAHILFKTEGKDEAAVRKTADAVLAKAKAGADFAALARQYSDDEASRDKGGDLDFFGRGAMVPEFEQVAFSLPPGSISDLVKTQYGFHIVKVIDKRPAVTKSLEEVRGQIEDQIKWERAQAQARRLAENAASAIKRPADLERVAKSRGLKLAESGYFQRDEPIAGIGFAPEVGAWAFQLGPDEVSPPIRTPQGFVILVVTGRQDSHLPKLDEVKERVREDVVVRKALEAARQKAARLAEEAKRTGDLARAAKAAGATVETTADLVTRGTALPGVGISPAVDRVAFSLAPGTVSEPILTETAAVVVQVLERKDVTATELAAGRESLRQELLADRRNRFFSAYMTKAKQRMRIEINRAALQQIVA